MKLWSCSLEEARKQLEWGTSQFPAGTRCGLCAIGDMYGTFPTFKCTSMEWNSAGQTPQKNAGVVAALCDSLPLAPAEPLYQVFMGNRFSSVPLFKMLRDRNIGCCGTTRCMRKYFPSSLCLKTRQATSLNWYTLGSIIVNDVNCICWIDNGPVRMLSTIHKVGPEHTVETVRRRPRITSTNSGKVRRVFGNASTKRLGIPKIVYD